MQNEVLALERAHGDIFIDPSLGVCTFPFVERIGEEVRPKECNCLACYTAHRLNLGINAAEKMSTGTCDSFLTESYGCGDANVTTAGTRVGK